jgi:parallel beta-helix repeat protein
MKNGVNNITINGNIFENNLGECIYLYNGASDNIIEGNMIINSSSTPIQIDLWVSANKCVRNMIFGNKIWGGTGRADYYSSGTGAITIDASYNTVKDNYIYNFGLHGILINGSYCTVQNNYILDCSQTTTNTRDGIIIDGNNNSTEVSGNVIISQTTTAKKMRYAINVRTSKSYNTRIFNNRIEGTFGTGNINNAGTNTQFKFNYGFVTENCGTATGKLDGGTIAHGLAGKPTSVRLTCLNATYGTPALLVNVYWNQVSSTTTNIVVNVYWANGTAISSGAGVAISWSAEYKP